MFVREALPGTAGNVIDQKGVLQRSPGTFHLRCRARENPSPAFLGEPGRSLPGAGGVVGPGVEGADPVLADHIK